MPKSTTPGAKASKPKKPHPEFPLFAHASGRWAKKIRGKLHYFGKWADTDAALALYEQQATALHAGRRPRATSADGVTVRDLVNAYLTARRADVQTKELTQRSWDEYHDACDRIVAEFNADRPLDDLGPQDFRELRVAMGRGVGLVTLGKRVQSVRTIFAWAADNDLVDRPIKLGTDFKKPSATSVRKHRQTQPAKVFTAAEIRTLLEHASEPLKTMILLGINCGFGNGDVGNLPRRALDLKAGWVEFPRPKTAVYRRIPLWPETVEALEDWAPQRPNPKESVDAGLVFITRWGERYAKETRDNPVAKEFAKLTKRVGLTQRGRGFYAFRHTFETQAGETADQVAVDAVMGHVDPSMGANYRHNISDERLVKVTEFVRGWLFVAEGK